MPPMRNTIWPFLKLTPSTTPLVKVATATSLAAIVFTSIVGAIAHGAFGNVVWDKALLLGIPAVVGVVIGQTINRRVSNRVITLTFAVFLAAIAARVAVG